MAGNFSVDGVDAVHEGDVHKGYENVQAVQMWMTTQEFKLDQLVLLGCSAGTLGLNVHAHDFLSRFPANRTAVVLDSWAGLTNGDSSQLRQWGLCENTQLLNWDNELMKACLSNKLEIQSATSKLIMAFPKVQFVGISSKTGKYSTESPEKIKSLIMNI